MRSATISCRVVDDAIEQLKVLEDRLFFTSSFLDRLEEVGVVDPDSGSRFEPGRSGGACLRSLS